MKKILFFTYDFPYPATSGGKVRAYNMLKFAKGNNDITLLSFIRDDFRQEYKKEIEKLGITDIYTFKRPPLKHLKTLKHAFSLTSSVFKSLYFNSQIEDTLKRVVHEKEIDIIHYESFYTSFYLNSFHNKNVRQIYGTENIEFQNYEKYIKKIPPLMNLPFKIQASSIRREEEHFAKISNLTLAVTGDEAEYFKSVGASNVEVIPNGVDTDVFSFKLSKRPDGNKLLFVGNFTYFPNTEGIKYFYNHIFKKLEQNYTLTIIGKGAHTLGIHDSRVNLEEFIPDIRDAYYSHDVLVSPIQIGGGTNFKVIEAMACGLPVIADSSRVKSLDLVDGEHVLTADNPEEYREKITTLLHNDALQGKLAKNAREHIENNYSWTVIGKKLNTIWNQL